MRKVPFIKMHGLGNDFVIVENTLLTDIAELKNFVINISNRRTGVGCDQFITYKKNEANVKMSIFNQDGSSAKACGNATRCLARLIFDKYGLKNVIINIDNKEIASRYLSPSDITVNMGEAHFDAPWMPKREELWQVAAKYMIEPKEMICVDIGNPHLVIFTLLSYKDQKIIGENLQKHELFAGGININFAKIDDDIIILKVWERGAGFTLACGSGAAATFAASSRLGFAADKAKVAFELGLLKMSKENEQILMSGPAAYVFSGEYHYE